ncbi:MAG: RnfABCDGE type electron transport complex subunit G [Rikenellaceae bacterium]
MKSTLINMILSLLGITLVASAGVGLVYQITKEPIAQAAVAATNTALADVLPAFDDTALKSLAIDDMPIDVYTAKQSGKVVGYAVKTMTKSGFSGAFVLMVGLTPDGKVINVNVLSHAETPGLGSKMTEEGNPLLGGIQGKELAKVDLHVSKDGGDVDALTAATITSRAYLDAIARAQKAYELTLKGGGANE